MNLFQCKSYDELSKIINDWINEDDFDSSGSETITSNKTSSTTTSSGYKSLDDAFADLVD